MFFAKLIAAVLLWVAMLGYAMPWLIDKHSFNGAMSAAFLTMCLIGLMWKWFLQDNDYDEDEDDAAPPPSCGC